MRYVSRLLKRFTKLKISMFSLLLRDCARLGMSVLCITSKALSSGKRVVEQRVKSCMLGMGFVDREEFEALRECVLRSQVSEKKGSSGRDKK